MKTNDKCTTKSILFHWHSFKFKLIFEGIIIGIITGLVIVLYRYIIEILLKYVFHIYSIIEKNPVLILPWIIFLILIGYLVGLLIKFLPNIRGSGIPQVEGILLGKLDMNWLKILLGKFFGGILSIGSGLSLGREGPSIQLGGAIGQGFSRIFKRIKIEEKYLITSGASAGLAAAFNAPLSGALFALEEVHKNFSPLILLSALSAALSADFVSSSFFGLKPVLSFNGLHILPLKYYIYIIPLGIIIGISGVVFNKVLLKTQTLYQKQTWLRKEFKIIIPMLFSVIIGIFLPQALGGGNGLISSLTANKFSLITLLIIVIVKFIFTMACYGSGAPGGIFLPLLAIGALVGNIYGVFVVDIFHFNNAYINNFIIFAMAGYFTAVVRAPITGTILITELTGSLGHLLSLSVMSLIAYIIADILECKPIYESLFENFLHNQDKKSPTSNKKGKSILEFVICMGSILDSKQVKEINWPKDCLLVAVKRGENEIIPTGDTIIFSGDYLIVLTNERSVPKINDIISNMAGNNI
ncbi:MULTISPECIES: ClC family H(+)/Cl(-) exchange transporter [Clostridium]|uniref:ClC family H(+)/Cl(-) exchange transporter n=1 Tax=Clostridium TaxID=1485 RepID=UPI0008258C57|nr:MULTISPECIES: ClC family H(+)/Cl(-) exchange transporter [Clostridium]PJI07242.1 ClC family H(+)/Cl(-) exchange transporter [Clostridium sp. CT7]